MMNPDSKSISPAPIAALGAQAESAITCKDSVRLVSLLRDRELDAAGHGALSEHLRGCPRCKIASSQFAALFAGLDALLGKQHGVKDGESSSLTQK